MTRASAQFSDLTRPVACRRKTGLLAIRRMWWSSGLISNYERSVFVGDCDTQERCVARAHYPSFWTKDTLGSHPYSHPSEPGVDVPPEQRQSLRQPPRQ